MSRTAKGSAALLCLLAIATGNPFVEARTSRGTSAAAHPQQPIVPSDDGVPGDQARGFSAAELQTRSDEQARMSAKSLAVEDIARALQSASEDVSLELPNSQHFANALRDYKDTGICNAWVDLETDRVSTGLSDQELAAKVQKRPRTSKIDLEDLSEAIGSHEVWRIVVALSGSILEPLPITCLIIGAISFLVWFFFLSWQTCIGWCRKACCCIASKKRKISWRFLLMTGLLGGGLAAMSLYLIILGQLGVHKSVNAIGSSSCAALDVVHAAEWGTQSDRMSDSPEQERGQYLLPGLMKSKTPDFVGLRGLVRNINGLKVLSSAGESNNAFELIKRFFQRHSNTDSLLNRVHNASRALMYNLNNFRVMTRRTYMKSYLLEALEPKGDSLWEPFYDAYQRYKHATVSVLESISLPSADLGDVDLGGLEAGATMLQDVGAGITQIATPVARLVPVALWSEIVFMVSGIAIAIAALITFFVTKGRRSTCLSGLTWNWLLVTVSLSFITTGAVFLASSIATPLCDAGVKTIWPAKADAYDNDGDVDWQLDRLTTSLLGDEGKVLGECMRKPDFSFIEASGQEYKVNEIKDALRRTQFQVVNSIPSYAITEDVSYAHQVRKWIDGFGPIVVFDERLLKQDPSTASLVNTFPEVLQSGITDYTFKETLPNGESVVVYGLRDLHDVIFPAALKGWDYLGISLVITSNYPTANDTKFLQWVEQQRERRKKKLMDEGISLRKAEEQARDYSEKMKNAALLMVKKAQLLEATVDCYKTTGTGVTSTTCKGSKLYGPATFTESNVIQLSVYAVTDAVYFFNEAMTREVAASREYVNEIFNQLIGFFSNVVDACGCSFIRKNIIEAAYLGCNIGADRAWNSALVRFIGQLIAILLALFIFVVWRIQKDNDYYRKKESKQAEPLLPDKEKQGDVKDDKDAKAAENADDADDKEEAITAFDDAGANRPLADREERPPDSTSMWA